MAGELGPRDIQIAIFAAEVMGRTVDLEVEAERRRKFQKEMGPMPMWVAELASLPVLLFFKWLDTKIDFARDLSRRTNVWALLGLLSWILTFCIGKNIHLVDGRPLPLIVLQWFYSLSVVGGYPLLLFYLILVRDPLHYVLRRSHKQLLESALVLFSSSWVYYTTEYPFDFSTIVPFLCLDLIPCLNLWWNFDNFGYLDCCLLILVDAALLCCRDRGVVALMAVTIVGLAMQFMKNAYRQYCSHKIKNQTLQHLV